MIQVLRACIVKFEAQILCNLQKEYKIFWFHVHWFNSISPSNLEEDFLLAIYSLTND